MRLPAPFAARTAALPGRLRRRVPAVLAVLLLLLPPLRPALPSPRRLFQFTNHYILVAAFEIHLYVAAMTDGGEAATHPGPLCIGGVRDVPTQRSEMKTNASNKQAICHLPGGHRHKFAKTTPHRAGLPASLSTRCVAALERLQVVLTHLTTDERRAAIAGLPLRVRQFLLLLMEAQRGAAPRGAGTTTVPVRPEVIVNRRSSAHTGGLDVRAVHGVHGTRYIAQLRIRSLRFYTGGQATAEAAEPHRRLLAALRDGVAAAGTIAWKDPEVFRLIFDSTLRQHNICEQELGLGAFVYMRADQWIDRAQAITSPRMGLTQAVALHARLVQAQAKSWEQLRREWVPLLRQTQKARAKALSVVEAEGIAEQAHRRHVKHRLRHAVQRVENALDHKKAALGTEAKKHARKQHRRARSGMCCQSKQNALDERRARTSEGRQAKMRRVQG